MSDKFGALPLPIPVPDDGAPVSDPFIQYALPFLQAVANARGGAAWAAVDKTCPPIKTTRDHNPYEMSFVIRDLPCLYMWRGEGQPAEWLSEDILVSHEKIHALWILDPGPPEVLKKRIQMANGITKMLTRAIEIGQDPAWVVPGDPDARAAAEGSVFMRWSGAMAISMSKWNRKVFIAETETNERIPFPCLEAVLDLDEELIQDADAKYAATGGVNLTLKTRDGQVVTDQAQFR